MKLQRQYQLASSIFFQKAPLADGKTVTSRPFAMVPYPMDIMVGSSSETATSPNTTTTAANPVNFSMNHAIDTNISKENSANAGFPNNSSILTVKPISMTDNAAAGSTQL